MCDSDTARLTIRIHLHPLLLNLFACYILCVTLYTVFYNLFTSLVNCNYPFAALVKVKLKFESIY